MSKGLKALQDIKSKPFSWKKLKDNLDTIEKDLNRLEEIDNGANVCIHINRYNELCDKEEILEIIKKKRVNVYCISKSVNAKDYNSITTPIERYLTETEFNLIKEWLENE